MREFEVYDMKKYMILSLLQCSFCFDEETEERRLRGSRRLKYSSSDKDHGKDFMMMKVNKKREARGNRKAS